MSMNPSYLSWYTSAIFGILLVAASLISVVPGHEAFRNAMGAISFLFSIAFASLAWYLQSRPKGHWIYRSKALSAALIAMAGFATVIIFLIL